MKTKLELTTIQERKLILERIEKYNRYNFVHYDVLDIGESDYNGSRDYLCFVGKDLIHFTEKKHSGMTWFRINGINNDVNHVLGQWIESFRDMNEIEEYFVTDSKFVKYIKTYLLDWVKIYTN